MAEPVPYLPDDQDQSGMTLDSGALPTPQLMSLPTNVGGFSAPSAEVATRRTNKTIQGLGDLLPYDADVIHQRFIAGQENALRSEAALKMDMQARNQKVNDLRYVNWDAQGIVSTDALTGFLTPSKPTDPDMVIEQGYTKNSLGALSTASSTLVDTPWSDQSKSFPDIQAQTIQTANDFGTKREFLQTAKENIDSSVQKQSWAGYLVDQTKSFTQLYQEGKLRGNVDGVSIFAGLGLGSNIEAQARKLFDMDNDTFKKTIAPVLAKLQQDNPALAADYVNKLLGQSDSEKLLSNIFTVFAPMDMYQGTKMGAKIVKGMFNYNAGKTAVRDILAEAKKPNATGADVQAAAGDLAGSAVKDVADNVVKGIQGTLDPVRPMAQAMTENFNIIADVVGDTPRNREVATRLQDQLITQTRDIPATIEAGNKVERIPLPLSSEQNINAINDANRAAYRGPWNSLLNVLSPVWDRFTNTYLYRMHLGNENGEYFSNPLTAANWARDNGHGDARILSGTGNVASEADEAINQQIDKATQAKADYQVLIDKQTAILKTPTTTAAEKKEARDTIKSIKEVGIDKQDQIIQKLRLKSADPANAKRIAQIKDELDNLKAEKIKHAALKISKKEIIEGANHAEALNTFQELHPGEELPKDYQEGFTTTKGRFVSREEASDIANKTSQLKPDAEFLKKAVDDQGINKFGMTAEDLKEMNPEATAARIKELEAESRAINYGKASAIRPPLIKQQGVGYYIEITKPLNETQPVIRDLMIKGLNDKFEPEAISDATSGISSWKNAFFGKYRSPEDTLSRNESKQRKTAVYAEAAIQKLGDDLGKNIEDIARGLKRFDDVTGVPIPWYFSYPRYYVSKPFNVVRDIASKFGADVGGNRQMFKEWEAVVNYARRAIDPVTKQEGYFFKDLSELENHYLKVYQRVPSFTESLAYFSKVEMDELNRVMTNISVYRNKVRLGTESHVLTFSNGAARTISSAFDGVAKKEYPGGDGNMAVFENGKVRVVKLGTLDGAKDRPRWQEQVSTGKLKAIEIFDPEARPLNGYAGLESQRIQYVLSDAVESKPISYNQVNRRGGGHFDYEYDHYLKQAIIRNETVGSHINNHYEGDTSVMALPNRAMGNDIGKHLDNVRELIKAGKIDEAGTYTKDNLMMEFSGKDGVHSWFKPGRDPTGKAIPPRLNLNEPFHVVPKGKTIYDMDSSLEKRYPGTFQDGTRHGSLARQFQVAYTKERDAQGLIAPTDIGTKEKALYKYEPAKLVDAMPTLNRALSRAIKSTFMDDYKMYAVEHWLREAEPYMKEAGENYSNIRSSPFYHFNNPVFKSGTPKEVENNLRSNQYKINQFIGVPNEFDTTVHAMTQHLVDAMYESGSKLTKDSKLRDIRNIQDTRIVPIWMLNKIHDPITKLRSITFNAKLGLFNLPQVLVQAQTYANIWAIAGRHGGAGTYAALLHGFSKFGDEEFLQHLDGYASRMNFLGVKWRPGEFAEARHELANTGFEYVAGEFATLDDAFSHKFVKNDFQKFLDLGQGFFRMGERSTRVGAYYTAFKEFRDLHPVGALTEADKSGILQRADLLTTNMSRASSSALHGGVLGLTTQFLSYQLRLAELFMGKRLGNTIQERAMARMRMIGMYSALYGVPAAVGVTGLPVSEDFRAAAINRGYIVGDNFVNSLFMEGIPSMLVAMITGGGDYQKGQFYNIGDRYGAQGFTQLREALRSDTAWWKILGGAGVTTAVNTITNADGFTKAILSFARGDTGDQRFMFKLDDLVDLGKEISSVNSAWKVIMALNTGRWFAKNEGYISEVTPSAAAWMGITGLSPQEQDDIFTKTNIVKERLALQKYVLNKYIEEIHRAVASSEQSNPDQTHDYMQRAARYLEIAGYPMDKRMQAIAIASKGIESRIKSENFNFYLKNVPTDQSAQNIQTYTQQLQLDRNRTQ